MVSCVCASNSMSLDCCCHEALEQGKRMVWSALLFYTDFQFFANWRIEVVILPASFPLAVPAPLWQPIHPLLQPFLCHVFVLLADLCPLGPEPPTSSACWRTFTMTVASATGSRFLCSTLLVFLTYFTFIPQYFNSDFLSCWTHDLVIKLLIFMSKSVSLINASSHTVLWSEADFTYFLFLAMTSWDRCINPITMQRH